MSEASGAVPPDLSARRLGEFELREKIGEGGYGAIYRAEQRGLKRSAVVKILRPSVASDETTKRRFLREARLAASLDHPYAAHVYAFGAEHDGVLWIAMELVRGTPLSALLEQGPMPLVEFVPLLERLCEVVETAHERGIVHRDIKPQNVMVIARAGALLPKLLDLGIAKDLGAPHPEGREGDVAAGPNAASGAVRVAGARAPEDAPTVGSGSRRGRDLAGFPIRSAAPDAEPLAEGDTIRSFESLTSAGDVMGSPAYMAPEQWLSADIVTRQCDIYSLGVLAYEAVAGRIPFSGTVEELAEQHLYGPVPRLPPGFPAGLSDVLSRAMAKNPNDRQGSALVFAQEVRAASGVSFEGLQLPRLARDVAERALRDYPQPIAEAVAELDAARGVYQALDAARRVARAAVRLVGVISIAAGRPQAAEEWPTVARELVHALRRRRLTDDEWLELARALASPFASHPEDHPVPPLVRFFAPDAPGSAALAALLGRRGDAPERTLPNERAAVETLLAVLMTTAELVRSLAFFSGFAIVVGAGDGVVELWSGVRRKFRVARAVAPGAAVAVDDAALLGPAGEVVPLGPLVVAGRPSAHAERELFLLDGRGRSGVVLLALPEGFEQTSDAALAWLTRAAAATDDAQPAPASVEAPYRGLAPFTAADADVFFGREREVESFVNRLRAEPLLVVVGPSGVGKSSFVRAGVLPALGEAFHAVLFRPGARPLAALRARLAELGVATDDLSTAKDGEAVSLRARASARARDETFVLVVDQFEEVFTLARDEAERAVFCVWLAALASSALDAVRVVFTLRDDFIARAQQETALAHRLAPVLELLGTPGPHELRRILVEPARRAGFAFQSEALVDEMVRAVEDRAGALALLSFAASKLWEVRDEAARLLSAAAYAAMGGVTGALAQHGEAVLGQMTPAQRSLVRGLFRRLVTHEGTGARTRHEELLAVLGGDDSARFVVERLVAARLLLLAEADDGEEYVEVIHEALFAAWPRIVEWRREDSEEIRFRDRIRTAAHEWEKGGRARGLVWRDELAEGYRRWRRAHPSGLTKSEEAFGKASLAERDRGVRLRAAVIGLLAALTLGTLYVARQQSLARRDAERATTHAEEAVAETKQANRRAEDSASRARDAARIAAAHVHVEDPTTQVALLRDVESPDPPPGWAAEARSALHAGVASVVYAQPSAVEAVAFSPDGQRVAVGGHDGVLRVLRADGTGTPTELPGGPSDIRTVAFSPDGRHVAAGSFDDLVRIWDLSGSKGPQVLSGHTDHVLGVAYSPDGSLLASASRDRTVRVWAADGAGPPRVLRGHTDIVISVAFSADGRSIASASRDKTVRLWNADGTDARLVLRHPDAVSAVAFVDGGRLVTGSYDGKVRLWNADGSGTATVLGSHTSSVEGIAVSRSGRVVSGSLDNVVALWDPEGRGPPRFLRGHADPVFDVSISSDGTRVASCDNGGAVRIWDLSVPEDPRVLRFDHSVSDVALRADGKRVAGAFEDGSVRVWSRSMVEAPLVLRGHSEVANALSFSPDGRRLASASYDKTIRVWDLENPPASIVLRQPAQVFAVAFSPDGRRIASASDDPFARVWNADGTGPPLVLRGHTAALGWVAFSPDNHHVASGSYDNTVRVWNLEDPANPVVLRGHSDAVVSVSFSPDGRRLASGSLDHTVRVWNADGSGEPVVLRADSAVNAVTFSPDGLRIAYGAFDDLIRIARADGSGEPVVLRGHGKAVTSIAFAPEGEIFSASEDQTIRIWTDVAPLRPTDPRLWRATNYCLPIEASKALLAVDDDLARDLRARCLARVAAAR